VAYSPSEVKALALAIVVIILGIFAIIAFAMSSLTAFYLLAIMAVAFGFYMAYYIGHSNTATASNVQPQKKKKG